MLCGSYSCSGGPTSEVDLPFRLRSSAAGEQLLIHGPLAVSVGGKASVRVAEVAHVHCIMDGHLYEPDRIASELGVAMADHPALVALVYRRRGNAGLAMLRGRFCVIIWDAERRQGVLACDPLATRSLFLRHGPDSLLFASEVNELLSVLTSRPGPDPTSFLTFLAEGGCPSGRTLFEGVSRLGPGEFVDLGVGRAQVRSYWRPRYAGTLRGSRSELADGLRDEIERSIARRLSGGPTGVILSGGVDSSIVAAVTSRLMPRNERLRTYSAVFPGSEFDESSKIEELTSALGIQAAAFALEPQGAISLAVEYAKRWQMPLVGAGALIDASVVAEAAGDGAELILDGQTGDEVFGFSPYLVADRVRRGRVFAALALARRWPIGRPVTRHELVWILTNCGLKAAAPYRLGRVARGHRTRHGLGPAWLLPQLRKRYAELDDVWRWKVGQDGPRWWRYLADGLIQGPHRELRTEYLRHRAAGVGATNESPLYDLDLINYCLRLPPELAFDSMLNRPLAREAMRGIIPERVRLQPQKAVFSSFCTGGLMGADAPAIDRLFAARDAELGAYVDMERVRSLWARRRQETTDSMSWGTPVWRLAAAEIWLRLQSGSSFLDELLAGSAMPRPVVRAVELSASSTFFRLPGAQVSA